MAEMISEPTERAPVSLFTWFSATQIVVLVGIIAVINLKQIAYLMDDLDRPNWSHGLLIPFFSIYLVYSRWREIITVQRKTCWLGLPVLIGAALLHVAAYRINNSWTCQVTMILLLASLLLFLAGWQMFKVGWLPILFLLFMMPLPDHIYGRIALPLQNFAAACTTGLLTFVGVQIEVDQSMLLVTDINHVVQTLRVEEACSGMRLLMAFMALSVAMAYLTDRPLWQRVVLVAMGIPAAIFANVLRVIITSVMFVIDKREFGQDFMHEFTGILMLIPAGLLLWLISGLMSRLFVDVDDEDELPADDGAPA